MNKRMKSGSWANLRAFSVHRRDKFEKNDQKDCYVDDKSNSAGSAEYVVPDPVWHEDLGSQKSFSFSTVAIQRTRSSNAWNNESNHGEQTPLSKRRSSVKRIFGRKSAGAVAPNQQVGSNEKVEGLRRKEKTASKRDSLYFYLYSEALEKGLFGNDELDIWNIQERFPNDDLRFYEGIFSVETQDFSIPMAIGTPPLSPTLVNTVDTFKRLLIPDKLGVSDGVDIPCSPAVPRKMVTATATVHPISNFKHNPNRPPQPVSALTKIPSFQRLSPGLQAKFKKMAQRRQSAPSIVIRGVLGRSTKPPSAFQGRDDNIPSYSPNVNDQRLSFKFGSHGATLNLSKRKYVMEGKVQLTAGMQTQDRYMFLFTDLLLIAKAKSGSNFKLKYRVRVCELWTASCLDDVCELPQSKDKSFVIGWPTTNFVATFSTPESKELWLNALLKRMQEEKERETPKVVTLKIINRDSSNINHIKMLKVFHRDTAKDVVRHAVKEFEFEESEDQYQLWVMSKKEATAYPLIGHENPHAIHVNHVRDFISANGILPETEISSVAKFQHKIDPEIRDRCQFILRNSQQSPKYNIDLARRKISRIKAKTPAKNIFNWGRKKGGQRNESSDSGHVSGNSVGSEGTTFVSSSPPSTSPPATPKLFSLPLGQVCDNAELPSPIATMLDILFRKAPYTSGIFRRSPSAKITRQLKRKLDEEIDIDLEEESIHVVAALVKDFLRNVPGSVLDCTMYDKWVEGIRTPNEEEKLQSIRRLLMSLDACNRVLIRRLAIVLNRIASRSDRNKMTSHNLALCISPSLLWDPGCTSKAEAPIKVTEVTEILKYFIDECVKIVDGIAPTDVEWPQKIDYKSDNDDDYEGDCEKLTVDECVSPVPDDITSNRGFSESMNGQDKDDDVESDNAHFIRSRITRRQFPRRKTGARIDAARLLSLSQDSLDKVLMDVTLTPSPHAMDDIILNESGMSGSHCIRKRGKGYMSNDSGFTTLSGEEEENNLGRSITRESAGLPISSSAGSNMNELAESTDERIDILCGGLRRLWEPNLLNIENGMILDDVELNGIEEEQNTERSFTRRKSQPAPHRHRRHNNSVTPEDYNIIFELENNRSRLVDAITSPVIEYDESDDEPAAFISKPPTYVRLNDRSDSPHFQKYDEDRLAKEYLKQLRDQSPGEVEESISKAVYSSGYTKQYTAGVTVAVDDVRPPATTEFRPVTLSLHGLGETQSNFEGLESSVTSHDFKSVTTPSKPQQFFIGDDESLASTPDALSSSQEDVFNGWSNRALPLNQLRGRNRTDGEIKLETPKTAPIRRKFNSTASPPNVEIDVTFIRDTNIPNTNERIISIQKLTENLQQMPDFAQRSCGVKSELTESVMPLGRRKASSVRESRRSLSSQQTLPSSRSSNTSFQPKFSDWNNRELNVHISASESSRPLIANESQPIFTSSSRNTFNQSPETESKETSFDRDLRSRRACGRRRANISAKMTKNSGSISFSKSLPASDWRSLQDDSKRDSSNDQVVKSVNEDAPETNTKVEGWPVHSSAELNTSDALKTQSTIEGSIQSSSFVPTNSYSSPTNSVLTSNFSSCVQSTVTSPSHHTTIPASSGSNRYLVKQANGEEKIRVRRKVGVITPPAKVVVKSTNIQRSSPTLSSDDLSSAIKNQADVERRIGGLVIRTSSDDNASDTHSNSQKRSISVQLSAPISCHKSLQEKSVHRITTSQPVSDNLLFALSESFAFGNRKSPRCITPDPLPHDSPVSTRRRRAAARTSRHENQQSLTPERRRRHYSVDRYIETSTKSPVSVHVTSVTVPRSGDTNNTTPLKHLQPPQAPKIIPRDKNANDLLPFIGIIQSEESYV